MLATLRDAGVPATFFVPGVVAERHPRVNDSVLADGHEVALHGHSHRRLDEMDADAQREDLERGLSVVTAATGASPAGYRAPAWELTPATLSLLGDHRFLYDSSLM